MKAKDVTARNFMPRYSMPCYSEKNDQYYLECLYDASQKCGVMLHAYVLMTNYVHMLLTPDKKESICLIINLETHPV